MLKSAILMVLVTLSSTMHALHIPRSVDPFKCHLSIMRFEEAYCARRFYKDLEDKKEKSHGSPVLRNTCKSWDNAPFRGWVYSWQSCAFYQQPWRPEMGRCNLTLYTEANCDESGFKVTQNNINRREALTKTYGSNCYGSVGDNSLPYRSVSYSCEEPGYVAGI